ncbi:MAG: hypothetical protein ACOC1K_03305 [Nanoarchaeota archaeon]
MNKVNICNLALSLIGNKTITDIETPSSAEEKVCQLWYDISRKEALVEASPNFARTRKEIPITTQENPFGFNKVFKKPIDCLKVLGIGEADNVLTSYNVEGGYIYTNEGTDNKLRIRYIKDITDENLFTATFIKYFAFLLASNICYQINKDQNLIGYLNQLRVESLKRVNTVENQESKITIKSASRIHQAQRTGHFTGRQQK